MRLGASIGNMQNLKTIFRPGFSLYYGLEIYAPDDIYIHEGFKTP